MRCVGVLRFVCAARSEREALQLSLLVAAAAGVERVVSLLARPLDAATLMWGSVPFLWRRRGQGGNAFLAKQLVRLCARVTPLRAHPAAQKHKRGAGLLARVTRSTMCQVASLGTFQAGATSPALGDRACLVCARTVECATPRCARGRAPMCALCYIHNPRTRARINQSTTLHTQSSRRWWRVARSRSRAALFFCPASPTVFGRRQHFAARSKNPGRGRRIALTTQPAGRRGLRSARLAAHHALRGHRSRARGGAAHTLWRCSPP